ncbi:MAG TPA: hypothetical protein VE569_06915 [Acidimicrobiia bacterium]|nr:hypothetical protein [Acidimicrobiia bacterium]
MKVFVAADRAYDDDDFSFTVPGELVHFPPTICACDECGCERAMAGFVSHRATTSFVVRDLEMDADTYTGLLFTTMRDGGWVSEGSAEDRRWIADWAKEHIEVASGLPLEVPLRIRFDRVTSRHGGHPE